MDLILTGRPVDAEEAERIGLANRVTDDGKALEVAVELGHQIAGFPQVCMRNDHRSVRSQWGAPALDALLEETRLGLETLASPETAEGVARFVGGAGRGGTFA
jgi:enoyl-CoA hydratase